MAQYIVLRIPLKRLAVTRRFNMVVGLMTDRKLDEKVAMAEAAFAEMVTAQKEAVNTEIPAPALENTETTIEAQKDAEPKEEVKKEVEGIKVEDENSGTWKHKYEVLIGKYNAEIPRMAAENKDLKSQIAELQKAVEDVQSKVTGKEETVRNEDLASRFKRVKENLGDESVEDLLKLVESKINNIPKQYEEKVSRLEQKVEDTGKRQILTEKQTYNNMLKQLIPGLITKNENPKFLEFLSNVIPFSGGKTYEQRLHEADSQNDVSGVAEIFNAFYTPSKSNGKKHDIEEILEPGKPKPKLPNVEEKKIYTKAEIKQFDQDVVRGKYTGKDTLRQKLEDDYTLAKLEGRVR